MFSLGRWGSAIAEEVAELPATLERMRKAMAELPAQLDHELSRTAASLERILPEVSGAVGGMDTRLHSLDTTISELRQVIFGLLAGIPGVRRVLRRATPTE